MNLSNMRVILLAVVVAVTGACATMQPSGESITGCLNPGAVAGQYVLTDEKTKNTIMVTGTPELARHLTHRVTVTGSMTKAQDKELLNASWVQHLAVTCY